jgi:hypothetical protein
VVEPGRDDHDLAPGQLDVHRGHTDAVEQHAPLLAHELGRVGGERLQLVDQTGLCLDQRIGHRLDVLVHAAGELELPGVDDAVVQPDLAAVLDGVQGIGADRVQQRDPGVDENLGAQVREPPGDRG